jgi:hypothetical protein
MRLFARIIIVPLALALVLTGSILAHAQDSDAPAGAHDRWLPCESWVMFHWLPFNEQKFFDETGITRYQLKKYLYASDNNKIGDLVRKRHKDPDAIIAKLMKRWDGKVSDKQFAELTRRANALMTQSHLSQHVFFHLFHDPAVALNSRWIFNVAPGDYMMARMSGFPPKAIARHGHVPVKQAVRRALVILRREQERGIRKHQTTRAEARLFLHRQRAWTNGWLNQNIHIMHMHKFPHGNPAPKGGRLKQSCTFMTGANHEHGAHDDA